MLYVDCLLSPEQRVLLTRQNVEFGEVTLGSAVYHRSGIAFPEAAASIVAQTLGFIIDSTQRPEPLMVPGQELRLQDTSLLPLLHLPSAAHPITEAHRAPGDWFSSICTERRNKLKLGLVLSELGLYPSEQQKAEGVLFINYLSSPAELKCRTVEDWTEGSDRYACPRQISPDYLRIVGSNRKVVALFRGDKSTGTLWFLSGVRKADNREEFLDYILTTVEHHMCPEFGAVESYEKFREAGARRRYIRRARQVLREEQRSIDGRIVEADNHTREARQQLIGSLREVEAARLRQKVLAGGSFDALLDETTDKLEKEFDALSVSPEFESVDFRNDGIVVRTRKITIEHDGRVYDFGRYDIAVSQHDLKITSANGVRSRSRAGCCHPHVTNDGRNICLGNLTESVARLQASMEFETLLGLLVNYLEVSYNPADRYSSVDDFGISSSPAKART